MPRGFLVFCISALLLAIHSSSSQELVTVDRIGRPDAPNVLTHTSVVSYTNAHPTPEFARRYAEIFEQWARANPDWRIDLLLMTDNIGQEQARLLEQARAGRAPDCGTVDSFQLPLFIQQGVLQPVTAYFSPEEIEDFFPFVREGVMGPDGEMYAYWMNTDLRVLYRRTDLVPEAPRTWDELIEAALSAKEQDPRVDGLLFNGGRWEGTTFDNLAHFWSQGGRLLDDEGRPIFHEEPHRTYLLNTLEFLRRTVETGAAPQRVATIMNYNEFLSAAQAGTVAMFIGGHWQYFQLREALPPEAFALWEVSPIPAKEAGQGATGTGGWAIAAFSSDPDKVAACMDFARAVYMGPAAEITGHLPTSASLFETLPRFDEPIYAKFREYLEAGQARPGFPIYPELSNQFQVMIGEVLAGTRTPSAALDDTARRVGEAYERMMRQ